MRTFISNKMGRLHTTIVDVQAYLDENLPNRWIGRRGSVKYSPRSPDLTPLDFFLWGFQKEKFYATKLASFEELRVAIER